MKTLFGILLLLEVLLLLCALQVLPWFKHPDNATGMFAVNLVLLIVVGKRLRKKPACCQ